ncbi:MaoC family dehydratase [Nocardioides ginsengisoli]|uniref:MaoC family dehydratase n=1 Tax=Nocardioides ginsengisoli TaxID=363868 RepID=A0ABW3W4C4_9ACTN
MAEIAVTPRVLAPDEYVASVGELLGRSGWQRIDQGRIDAFAAVTGDDQWIHVDRERAAGTELGTTIAHGYLTLSLLPSLVGEVYRVEGVRKAVNYGLDRVRFPAPVPAGSRVRAAVRLVAAERGGDRVRAVVETTVEREGDERPACVARSVSLLYLDRGDA